MKINLTHAACAVALSFVASLANAALIDRGGGLIYDTDFNITWLSDANYAMTSGYDADGMMTWDDSMSWAGQLQYAGYDNWRLPSAFNQDGSSPCSSGECDNTEMGHLYFIELSGLRGLGTLPTNDPDFQLFSNTIQEGRYWTSTVYDNLYYPNYAWQFQFDRGYPGANPMSELFHAWAVHDGDIGASTVPVPAAAWLLGSGQFSLIGVARR